MSADSGAANGSTALKERTELIHLDDFVRQTDTDGRYFYSCEFVTQTACKQRAIWKWTLLRSGNFIFNLHVEPLSDRSVTLSSVVLFGRTSSGSLDLLMEQNDIRQSSVQSGEFSVDANSWPRFDEQFIRDHGARIDLRIELEWTEEEVNDSPLSSDCMMKGLFGKVKKGGDTVFELVSSDGQSFFAIITVLEAKSAYFNRFFATEGWKEQAEGRMVLAWPSVVVEQMIHYVYLNDVDGDVCDFLPDLLDAAQVQSMLWVWRGRLPWLNR